MRLLKQIKTILKPLAAQAIKDKKWAGWQMLQSVTETNKYIFIHYFNARNNTSPLKMYLVPK